MANLTKPRLVIGNKNYSSWSLRPWLLLKHARIAFDEVRVPLFTAEGEDLLHELSPTHKVPVLYAQGLVLWDSLAICETISDLYPDRRLWPDDTKARAHARAISSEMHSGFEALREHLPMNCRRTVTDFEPPVSATKDIIRIQTILTDALELHSGKGPWLYGRYSIGDAMYAPVVSRFRTYGIRCGRVLGDYCDRVLDDPHMKAWYEDAVHETEVIQRAEI